MYAVGVPPTFNVVRIAMEPHGQVRLQGCCSVVQVWAWNPSALGKHGVPQITDLAGRCCKALSLYRWV